MTRGASFEKSNFWPFHNSTRKGSFIWLVTPAIQALSRFCTNKIASGKYCGKTTALHGNVALAKAGAQV